MNYEMSIGAVSPAILQWKMLKFFSQRPFEGLYRSAGRAISVLSFSKPEFVESFCHSAPVGFTMKMNIFLPFALLAVSCGFAVAQTQVQPPARPYSVVSYNLTLDWRNVFEQKTQIF